MDTKQKGTPIDLEEFKQFVCSIGCSKNWLSRMVNAICKKSVTEEEIMYLDYDNYYDTFGCLSCEAILKFFVPYQKMLIAKHYGDGIVNGDIKSFKTLIRTNHSKFMSNDLFNLLQYRDLCSNMQKEIRVILDKYQKHLLDNVDAVFNNYKEDLE